MSQVQSAQGAGRRFGPYSILGEIARGGQGAVVRARLESSGDLYALKLLTSREGSARKRFLQEGKVLAALTHPNLLRVTDLGEQNGITYMAMDLVAGLDLARYVQERGVPDPTWSAKVMARVAHALHYCHERGVVHRDLKPANVLIEEATDRPVLVDFGLVKRDPQRLRLSSLDGGSVLSRTGELKGTPKFMAPEQANPTKFGAVGPRADVYAMGATLFFLLTGRAPFEGATVVNVIAQVLGEDPPDPRSLNPAVPRRLTALVGRCLAKAPAQRPATAKAFAEDLAAALGLESWLPSFGAQSDPRLPSLGGRPLTAHDPIELGPYEVISQLGKGGMGVVYRARHSVLEVERAVKVLTTLGDPRRAQRFQREIRHLARVHHPNVVGVHESGHEGAWLWYAMDLIGGEPLDEALQRGSLPFQRAIEVCLGVARGIGALHRVGIVHRDIKPQNVVLRPNGSPVVLDLGLAVAPERDARLTETGAVVGTPAYMAPEQIQGLPLDARADVYALGLLLFELLTGRRAVEGDGVHQVLALALAERIPAPSSIDPDLPAGLDALCSRAVSVDPERRPVDADAFAEALVASTRRRGPSRRARRRLLAGAMALSLLGFLGLWSLARREPRSDVAWADSEHESSPITLPPAARPELSPQQLRDAERGLARLKRRKDPRLLHEDAKAWLKAYPGHDRASEVVALARAARIRYPARAWSAEARGVFVDSRRAVTWLQTQPDRLTLWEVQGGAELGSLELAGTVREVVVAPDRKTFVVGGVGSTVLWVKASTREVLTTFETGLGLVRGLAFSSTENVLAVAGCATPSAGGPYSVVLLDLGTGRVVRRLAPVRGQPRGVAFSGDGARVVVAAGTTLLGDSMATADDLNNGLWIYDAADGRLLEESLQASAARFVTFAPDGTTFASGNNGGQLLLFDVRDGARKQAFVSEGGFRRDGVALLLTAHGGATRGAVFTRDQRRLYSIASEVEPRAFGELTEWEVGGGAVRTIISRAPFYRLDLSPDEAWLLLSTEGEGVQLWPAR